MAWNGSNGKVGSRVPRDRTCTTNATAAGAGLRARRDSRPYRNGLLAGLVIVALGGAAVWWFFGRAGGRSSDEEAGARLSHGRITEVAPQVVTNKVVEVAEKPKQYRDMSREEKLKYWRDKYGDNLPDSIKPIVYYLENPPKEHYRGKSRPEAIFHRKSERQIAAFLSVTPGNWMMRPKVFDKRFDDDFAQSMAEKIEITPDDTEEQRKLKELVINAKKELVERLKAGETPSEIMTATAKELYDLGQYRQNLRKEVIAAQHDPNLSDQDVADMTEAANKMLEAKGLKGLRSIHPAIRQGNLARRAEKAAQKAAQKESAKGDK